MLSALGFLTVLPARNEPGERTMAWFPVVGGLVGAALAGLWFGAEELWSPGVVAALVVSADLALTGMLHVDGLADTADGLLPHLDRARRLEVMRAPDVGAFALAVVPTVLLLRWVALAGDTIDPWVLVPVWAASRSVVATVPALVPYARPSGLASAFLSGGRVWFLIWLVPTTTWMVVLHGALGIVAAAALVVASTLATAVARRRLGGFTGDVLGATVVLGETAALVTLAAA